MYVKQRGDTIIEVMLAFVVFAVLAVGAISVMNRGVASAQDSLEVTLVRSEIDAQAETLRFLHQSYIDNPTAGAGSISAKFGNVLTYARQTDASNFGDNGSVDNCTESIPGVRPFILDPVTGNANTNVYPMSQGGPGFAQIVTIPSVQGYGLWIEAVEPSSASTLRFVDFHIRACWYSVSSDVPKTLGTIVRLYVPAR
jgi:type II secretory pathway pseudopilin PulG